MIKQLSSPAAEDQLTDQLIFVDLETTGPSLTTDQIIEIGLVWYENGKGWQHWQQLLNPGIAIPPFVRNLTGISQAMVDDAPDFTEMAAEIREKLKGRILVAHNARFDYGFLNRAFCREGTPLSQRHLCSLRLARSLEPEQRKHGLDALQQRWPIRIESKDRHRALGDCLLVAQLWQQWQLHYGLTELETLTRQSWRETHLPPEINAEMIGKIPATPGVYLFYGENDALLYIGKSINMRERVLSHFSEALRSNKEMKLSQQTRRIEHIPCAGELSALLLESELIKQRQPVYNRRLRRSRHQFSWYLQPTPEGFLQPRLIDLNDSLHKGIEHCYGIFKKASNAREALQGLAKKHHLCLIHSGLAKGPGPCFGYQLKQCRGACTGEQTTTEFNQQLMLSLRSIQIAWWPFRGAIAIHEYNQENSLECWHLINQWHYLGAVSKLSEAESRLSAAEHSPFDLDCYRILQQQMRKLEREQLIVFE
ncbi:exonuclease domain-containing protein [Marinobacterium jannaschii]|uniref:exonuclease domain-containing protein n=1 Tax=Marinobacterium jannaschii TaxID=64970 RepID=UPI0006874248|nr:exonuclease domain-containing protein [Marinobacterium jannaschii]